MIQCQNGLLTACHSAGQDKHGLGSTAVGNPTPANRRPRDTSFRVYIIQESETPVHCQKVSFCMPCFTDNLGHVRRLKWGEKQISVCMISGDDRKTTKLSEQMLLTGTCLWTMRLHTCNPGPWEVESVRPGVQGHISSLRSAWATGDSPPSLRPQEKKVTCVVLVLIFLAGLAEILESTVINMDNGHC